MKQAEGHPSAYVAELRQGDWRVVVPIRGKLSPRIAQRSFRNHKDASAWLQSEGGAHAVNLLRTKLYGAGESLTPGFPSAGAGPVERGPGAQARRCSNGPGGAT